MNLDSNDQTEDAAAEFVAAIRLISPPRLCIWLIGELGVGKTTFCRGFLRAFGHSERVPSPTYTLIEPYSYAGYQIYHLDLYRLVDSAEIEFLGIDAIWENHSLLLVEWPENAVEGLPEPDLKLSFQFNQSGNDARKLICEPKTSLGSALVKELSIPYQT
ncbi:MAG: tRNA (adenosine(37)-N6)-threonylcarbamoyltransferase complex ATPase subunit type 1 TsaE [Pseudomonadota bacterium]|nr:tRNA (adenosine(37)-N6)-threonylcarbamoyltransferase complex ATPase subunit type 1 TsaE [Pseudomonadota bacterium]